MMRTADATQRCRLASLGLAALLSPLALTLACTSTTDVDESGPLPSILLTNGTCSSGTCTPLEIRAFPSNQPRTPGGYWSIELGTVSQEYACLKLHRADTFRVIGQRVNARPDTTYFIWKVGDTISLGMLEPGASALLARPETEPFVPKGGSGWSVILPGDKTVSPAEVCG
jgi:hypothetical protein